MSKRQSIDSSLDKTPATVSAWRPHFSSVHGDDGGRISTVPGRSRKRVREYRTSTSSAVKGDYEDEFAGLDDDDIRGVDDTPFKSSTSNCSYVSSMSTNNINSSKSGSNKLNHRTDWELSSSREKTVPPDDAGDEFAGIDDDDIREIDETPFKDTVTSTINSATPRSLLSTVMQLSSSLSSVARATAMVTATKQQPKQQLKEHSLERDKNNNEERQLRYEDSLMNIVTNLESHEDTRDSGDKEKNVKLSLDQLTQEEVNFDAMFESGDPVGIDDTSRDEADYAQDNSKMSDYDDGGDPSELRALKQPTLSQFYSREDNPPKQIPKIANFAESNGRHFMKGDIWQHKTVSSGTTSNHVCNECSNLIVKIESFSTERIRGGKREKVAKVENKFYLPIENVPWLGSDLALTVIDDRRSNGRIGPEFVEYKLRTRNRIYSSLSDTTPSISVPRFPLQMLGKQIKVPVTSDLVFGYDDNGSTKAGCFFKFNHLAFSQKKRIILPKNKKGSFTALELYAGAGGFSLGLKDSGFCVTHHVDNNTAACSTLQANFPDSESLQCSVEDFLIGCLRNPTSSRCPKIGSITLLHGSSPCQGFSRANRNGGANDAANNAETYQFMDVVKHFKPPFVTFENVEGISSNKNKIYVQRLIAEFLKMSYQVRLCFVTASDYGDPQDRDRVFILAAKEGLELPCLPQATHGDDPSLLKKKTVADALGFLEDIPPLEYEGEVRGKLNGITLDLQGHILRSSEQKNDDVQLVARARAPTVIKRRVIRHYKNSKRPLTRLERACLQSFPPTYKFYGTDSEIRDQIGNAVPVCLARAIGKSVMKAIQQSEG